jgi:hypothetical protein
MIDAFDIIAFLVFAVLIAVAVIVIFTGSSMMGSPPPPTVLSSNSGNCNLIIVSIFEGEST